MTTTDETVARLGSPEGHRPKWLWLAVCGVTFSVIALLVTALRPPPQFPFVAGPTGLAQKPTAGQAPYLTTNQIIATAVVALIGVIGVIVAMRMSWKGRTLLPLMVALSTAMIVFPEVFYDVIGAVYFPFSHTEPLGIGFTILGRTMPIYIIAGWFGYGVFAVVTFALLTTRPSTRILWYTWGLTLLGDVVFEEILLKYNLYYYYGNQPLVLIARLPWWWMPCNSVGLMLAAAIAYRLRDQLRGPRALCMLAIMPMSVTAVYGFIALPSWVATNSDFPWLITQLLGLATVVLGIFAFMGVLKFVLNRSPLDLDYKPAAQDEFIRVR